MRPDELSQILKRRPFDPVRIHMSSGEVVEVTHPDAAIVTRSAVFVGVGGPDVHERVAWYNLLHIVKIETMNGEHVQRAGE